MTCAPDATILAALERRLGPKGFTRDPAEMEPWLSDWRGRVHGQAAALLSPADTDEVQYIVRLAAEARVGLVPQGGNSSMVAGATPSADGSALLLSLRRMNRIRSLSPEDNVAVAEAGVILSDLHQAALGIGRRFPLSLGAKGTARIGGLISTNAGGTQVLRFGTMRSLVVGIEAEGAIDRVTVDCGFTLVAAITRQSREELALVPGSSVITAIKATAIHVVRRS